MKRLIRSTFWSTAFVLAFAITTTGSLRLVVGDTSESDGKPVVLVLAIAAEDTAKVHERRFITQLALALEQFRIETIDSGLDDFADLKLAQRLERIKPLAEGADAVATLWLDETSSDITLLHLVALSTSRALVRIVEAPQGPDAALELALAAQELLGQAYLLSPDARDQAVEQVVAKVTQEAISTLETPMVVLGPPAPEQEIKAPEPEHPRFSVLPFGAARGGIAGHRRASPIFGGGWGLGLWPTEHLFLRTSLSFLAGIRNREEWGVAFPFFLSPALAAGYIWSFGPFGVGPEVELAAIWNKIDFNLVTTGNHSYSWWSLRAALNIGLLLEITELLCVLVEPGIGALPIRKRFYLEPDGETIYTTPYVDWGVAVGLRLLI